MWGKIKNTGDDWMYPKPQMDLRFLPTYAFATQFFFKKNNNINSEASSLTLYFSFFYIMYFEVAGTCVAWIQAICITLLVLIPRV